MPVTAGTIAHNGQERDGLTRVCGTCGVVVAQDHVQRHITWHATTPATAVVTTVLPAPWQ